MMPGKSDIPAENERIDSWKEIAAFFGRDERTVKRWKKSDPSQFIGFLE